MCSPRDCRAAAVGSSDVDPDDRPAIWLPPGRGRRASASQSFEPGERIWIGADLGGGERSTSAVYYLNERLPTQGYRAASS